MGVNVLERTACSKDTSEELMFSQRMPDDARHLGCDAPLGCDLKKSQSEVSDNASKSQSTTPTRRASQSADEAAKTRVSTEQTLLEQELEDSIRDISKTTDLNVNDAAKSDSSIGIIESLNNTKSIDSQSSGDESRTDLSASIRHANSISGEKFGKLRKMGNLRGNNKLCQSTGQRYQSIEEEDGHKEDNPLTLLGLDARSDHNDRTKTPTGRTCSSSRQGRWTRVNSSPNPPTQPKPKKSSRFSVASMPMISARDFGGRRSAGSDLAKQRATSIKAMTAKDIKKELGKELNGGVSARVKNFRQAKQISGSNSKGDKMSEAARKAEEFRKRRASTVRSLRSSLTSLESFDSHGDHFPSSEFDLQTPETCRSTPTGGGTPGTVTICRSDIYSDALRLPLTVELAEDANALTTVVGELEPVIESNRCSSGDLPEVDTKENHQKLLSSASELLDSSKAMKETYEASSITSATAPLMTHDENHSLYEEPHKCALECWEEENDQMEKSNTELLEQIAMLQRSLQRTEQEEREEIQKVQDTIEDRKRAAAQDVQEEHKLREAQARAKHEANLKVIKILEDKQNAMIDRLYRHNKTNRKESQGLNIQLLSLMQVSDRLQKATKETKEHTKELNHLLVEPAQEEQIRLLTEVQGYELERRRLEHETQKAKELAEQARHGRRTYAQRTVQLVHKVQHRAWSDGALLAAINDTPLTKSVSEECDRVPEAKEEKRGLFGWW